MVLTDPMLTVSKKVVFAYRKIELTIDVCIGDVKIHVPPEPRVIVFVVIVDKMFVVMNPVLIYA